MKNLISELRRSAMANTYMDIESDKTGERVDVRHFGAWETPRDADDDGDYDWQEPTRETLAELQRIATKCNVVFSVEEKNWVVFTAR